MTTGTLKSLVELAARWLRPGAKAETPDEMAEEAAFRTRAGEVWLAYHEDALWARRKLEAGLALTPEALEYMEREVTARKLAADARAKNLDNEDAKVSAPTADVEREPRGDGERDVGGGSNGVQEIG